MGNTSGGSVSGNGSGIIGVWEIDSCIDGSKRPATLIGSASGFYQKYARTTCFLFLSRLTDNRCPGSHHRVCTLAFRPFSDLGRTVAHENIRTRAQSFYEYTITMIIQNSYLTKRYYRTYTAKISGNVIYNVITKMFEQSGVYHINKRNIFSETIYI